MPRRKAASARWKNVQHRKHGQPLIGLEESALLLPATQYRSSFLVAFASEMGRMQLANQRARLNKVGADHYPAFNPPTE